MIPDTRKATASRRGLFAALMLLLFASFGCTSVGRLVVAATPTPTATILPTLRPTDTITPTPTITPSPSFTPSPTPTITPTPTETPPYSPTPTVPPGPNARVIQDTVNIRNGPGVTFESVGQVASGQIFSIVGSNPDRSWWQICCLEGGRSGWVSGTVVEVTGPTDGLAIQDLPTPPPPAPTPTDTPIPPTPTPAPLFYRGEGPLFVSTDNDMVTLWVKVYSGTQYPVEGWRLQVKRNGVVHGTSEPSRAVFENSILQTGTDTYKPYNLKFEIPNPGFADWEVYLIDSAGNQQSPAVPFTTSPGNPNKQVYIGFLAAGT